MSNTLKYTTKIDALRDRLERGKIEAVYLSDIVTMKLPLEEFQYMADFELKKSVVVLEPETKVITIIEEKE